MRYSIRNADETDPFGGTYGDDAVLLLLDWGVNAAEYEKPFRVAVDGETGEIKDAPAPTPAAKKAVKAMQAAVPEGGTVTISSGGKSATIRGKEQKPPNGKDGFGNPVPQTTKRGAVPAGPQVPATGG